MDKVNSRKKRGNYTNSFLWAIIVVLAIIIPYFQYHEAKKNMAIFRAGNPLECLTTGMKSAQKYLVEKSHWEINGYSFQKKQDGLMIRADQCK